MYSRLIISILIVIGITGCSTATNDGVLKIEVIDGKPWWFWDSLIQIFGIFITAWFVVYQLKKQKEHSISVEEIKFKNEINYQIYQKISGSISSSQQHTFARLITLPKRIYSASDKEKMISEELTAIDSEYKDAFAQCLMVLSVLEDYEITLTNLAIFKVVICTMLDELMDRHSTLRQFFITKSRDLNAAAVSSPIAKELEQNSRDFYETWLNLTSYLYDLSVECQNQLLGDIYKTKLKPRKPMDAKYIAITDNVEEIVDYFKNNKRFMGRLEEHKARYGQK